MRLGDGRAGAGDGGGGGGGLADRDLIGALRLHQRQARLDPALDHRPDQVQLLAPGVARGHPGVIGRLGLLDGAAGLGDPRLAGADQAAQLLHPGGVERPLDHQLARRRLVGGRRVGGLAPGDFGGQRAIFMPRALAEASPLPSSAPVGVEPDSSWRRLPAARS